MTRPLSIPPGSPEAISRRGVLLAAAGLGAVGMGTALADAREAEAKATEVTVRPASEAVAEFRLAIPAAAFDDLRLRLATTAYFRPS
jgi:hypothetical protein